MGIGFLPQALPIARGAVFKSLATSPYVFVVPWGIVAILFQTAFSKTVPDGFKGIVNFVRFLSKYSVSWCRASFRIGLSE